MNTKLFKLGLILAVFSGVFGCRTIQYVPVVEKEYVTVHDTTVLHADTVKIDVPREVIKEIVPAMDTLKMETGVAEAKAWLDTTSKVLRGQLKNKKSSLEKEVFWKERIVYRDSIQYKDKPYPVEVVKERKVVPLFWRIFGVIGILALCYLAFKIYVKFVMK